jgi:hypothetical protein
VSMDADDADNLPRICGSNKVASTSVRVRVRVRVSIRVL